MARQQLNPNILTIGLIAGVGYLLYKYSDKVFGGVGDAVSGVGSGIGTIGSSLGENTDKVLDTFGSFGDMFTNLFKTASSGFQVIIDKNQNDNKQPTEEQKKEWSKPLGYELTDKQKQDIIDALRRGDTGSINETLTTAKTSGSSNKATSLTYNTNTGVLKTNTGSGYSVAPSKVEALKSQIATPTAKITTTSSSKTSTGGSSTATSSPNYLSKITSSIATKKYI